MTPAEDSFAKMSGSLEGHEFEAAQRIIVYHPPRCQRNEVKSQLGEAFAMDLGPLGADIADGEIARLIGECLIEWRR